MLLLPGPHLRGRGGSRMGTLDDDGALLTREGVTRALADFARLPADPTAPAGAAARVRAAVCVLLVPGADDPADLAFVLTRRSTRLRGHPGQWALPGGRQDTGESARQAALRELDEELGVRADDDDVLGELDDYVTRSGYCITPAVVWAADRAFAPTPNADEVASVHVVPVRSLDVAPRFVVIPESERPVIQVPLLGGVVHAPTGAVLHQFSEVVLHGRATRVVDLEQPVFAWR